MSKVLIVGDANDSRVELALAQLNSMGVEAVIADNESNCDKVIENSIYGVFDDSTLSVNYVRTIENTRCGDWDYINFGEYNFLTSKLVQNGKRKKKKNK